MMSFGMLLKKFREQLNLRLDDVGKITGLSKQHLSNLESSKVAKNLSFDKLKHVIVLLSQKSISENQLKFYDNTSYKRKVGRTRKEDRPKSYFDVYGFPSKHDLNLNNLREMLFLATNLEEYKNSFIISESIPDNKNDGNIATKSVVDQYFEKNYPNVNIEQLNHNYQIWTLSDILGEAVYAESAEETAYQIIYYKIKHTNFVLLEDNTQWRTAYNNIKQYAQNILSEKKTPTEIKNYWKKKNGNIDAFLFFYGISQVSFFTRLRIYNPFSPDAEGNYNVGGKTLKSSKLIPIIPSDISLIIEKLKPVVFADSARLLDNGESYLITELGCYVNKKK